MTAWHAEWTRLAWVQLWQVTLLIVVVALTTRLAARNRPYLAHALWLVVLLKCVTPPVLSSAGGLFCWIETAGFHRSADVAQAARLPNGDLAFKPPVPATAIDVRTPSKNTATPNGQVAVRRAEVARSRQPLPSRIQSLQPAGSRRGWLAGVLIPAWVLGMVAMLGFATIRLALCWRLVRGRGRRVDPSCDRLMRSLAKRLKLWRPVRLVVTESRVGPAVIGLFRPTVLLPEVVIRGKRPEELEPILAHELLHARRGDLWVGALQMLVQAVWWFHPLVWWATRLTSREAERCCDEAVVAELGCSPARYARCLFDVLKRKQVLRPLPAVPGVRPVEITSKRMERIMRLGQGSHKRSPLWCWAVMALAAVVALPGAALVMSADVETTRVDAAADIPLGKTLLIGGLKTRDSKGNPQSMLVMLSPTNVVPTAVETVEPVLCQRVYEVADLVVPIPGQVAASTSPDAADQQPAEREADYDSLIELITSTVAPETWYEVGGPASIAPFETNLALVISQTEQIHEEIADLLEQLRRFQNVQIVLQLELVDLPRETVEKLGIDVGSQEGSPAMSPREARLLRALVEESGSAGIRRLTKIALFNGQRADLSVPDQGGRSTDETDKIVLQPVMSDDRRHVRLTIVLNPDGPKGSTLAVSVADGQTLMHEVTGQLSATIEEARVFAAEPVPGFFRGFRRVQDDAENRRKFLLVTPTVVIQEEEEERLGSVTPWRVIIQEEEEDILGIGPIY